MTNKNLIERLRTWVDGTRAGHLTIADVTEAASLIEQQEAVIESLSKAILAERHTGNEASRLFDHDWPSRERLALAYKEAVAAVDAALLAAKTHLGE